MSEQKPSTAEILAKIRAEKQGNAPTTSAASSPPPEVAPASPTAAPEPVASVAKAPAAPKPPAAKPSGTADILAAIRAQKSPAAAAEVPAAAKPSAPAGAKPTGTSDILAAIRAGKGGAAAAPTSDAPATKPATVAKAAPSAVGGAPKVSVEEMLKAVRGESAAPASVAAIVPTKPVLVIPQKPVAAKDKKAVERRSFLAVCLSPLAIAWAGMAATAVTWLLDLARFMFPNVLVEPPTKFKIGPASDYPLGTVSTKWLAARGVWIVHTDQYKGKNLIYALASVCTHLGCTPNWLEGEQKYKCPCHGSGFYVNGINFEGPAPRPLERVGIRIAPDGQLEVDKSVKFQEEMGQWEAPESYVDGALV